MTTALERSFAGGNPDQLWLVGNARLVKYSGQLLGAHLAHAGLILLWAGATTISEVSRYVADQPLGEQQMTLLPHLATLGFGLGEGSQIIDTAPYFAIGMLHLVASAVLAAGGLFHVFRGAASLDEATGRAKKFHYEWTDGKQLTLILGHHLLLLGIAAAAFVLKATQWGGIYDANISAVRIVAQPTVNPAVIFGYLVGQGRDGWTPWGMASVNSLEDIIGGHIWIAAMLILGGIWHIITGPLPFAKKILRINADAVLSYSLGGIALMGFTSAAFVAGNNLAYPPEFYGSDRLGMVNAQVLVGVIMLAGHLWHAYRGMTVADETIDFSPMLAKMAVAPPAVFVVDPLATAMAMGATQNASVPVAAKDETIMAIIEPVVDSAIASTYKTDRAESAD